jgi:hypothetical protein
VFRALGGSGWARIYFVLGGLLCGGARSAGELCCKRGALFIERNRREFEPLNPTNPPSVRGDVRPPLSRSPL